MRKNTFLLVCMVCVVLLPIFGVHADERANVFVNPIELAPEVDGATLLVSRFDQSLEKRLAASKFVNAKFGDKMGVAGAAEVQNASALLGALVEGKKLFEKKEYGKAVTIFQQALEGFETTPGPSDTINDYVASLVYLGASFVELGYGGDAKDAFRRLAALTGHSDWSKFETTVGNFDKGVVKKYTKTAKKWLKKKKGTLKISGAKSIWVAVNAQPIKELSTALELSLPRGRHRVACLDAQGSVVSVSWHKVKSGKTLEMNCSAEASVPKEQPRESVIKGFAAQLKTAPNDPVTVEKGIELCDLLSVDYLVFPFVRQDGEKLELIATMFGRKSSMTIRIGTFSFKRDIKSAIEQVEIVALSIEGSVRSFPYQNALVANFLNKPTSRLTGSALSAETFEPAPTSRSRTKARWYKSWWFWTTSVVVVGGLTTAGYYMLDNGNDANKFELEVSWKRE